MVALADVARATRELTRPVRVDMCIVCRGGRHRVFVDTNNARVIAVERDMGTHYRQIWHDGMTLPPRLAAICAAALERFAA